MDEIIRSMLKEEIAREEAKERAQNNGQLTPATKANQAAVERSEATLRQMQGYSYQGGGAGNWQTGPSGPFLGRATMDSDLSGKLGFDLPLQNFAGAGYSGNQQGNAQQQSYSGNQQSNTRQQYSSDNQQGSSQQQYYSGDQQGNTQQRYYSSQDYANQQRRTGY